MTANRVQILLCSAFFGLGVPATSVAQTETTGKPATAPQGSVLTIDENRLDPLASAAENYLVSYISEGYDGKNTVVFGQVSIPSTPEPEGGYPVVSWANGTTGFAPQCAPSISSRYASEYLNSWLDQGYAVLRTDYAAWGAAGPRTLIHSHSNAAAVADIVKAAHQVSDKLAKDWIVVGHSEGGGAAIWNAAMRDRTGDEFPLKGVIALAPSGPGILGFMRGATEGSFVHQLAQPYISVTVLAAEAVDPSIKLDELVAEPMMSQVEAARYGCLEELRKLPQLEPGQHLQSGAAFDKLEAFLNEQDPTFLDLQVPAFVIQTENDESTVTPETTEKMLSSLCNNDAALAYKKYAGASHRSVMEESKADAMKFAEAAFKEDVPADYCSEN